MDVTLRTPVDTFRRFARAYYLHFHENTVLFYPEDGGITLFQISSRQHGNISRQTIIFIVTAVTTTDLTSSCHEFMDLVDLICDHKKDYNWTLS
jgi:hypothetical protein